MQALSYLQIKNFLLLLYFALNSKVLPSVSRNEGPYALKILILAKENSKIRKWCRVSRWQDNKLSQFCETSTRTSSLTICEATLSPFVVPPPSITPSQKY